jgi:hypothetical protein
MLIYSERQQRLNEWANMDALYRRLDRLPHTRAALIRGGLLKVDRYWIDRKSATENVIRRAQLRAQK